MPETISHQLKGFMVIKLTGYSPERFLNLCSTKGIPVWNLVYRDDGYEFCMTLDGFLTVRPLVRKSKVRLRIKRRVGLPFFLQKNKKRVGFFVGTCLCFLTIYAMSLFIWDIQIEGNRRYTDEMVVNYLKSQEISWGVLISKVDCEMLESSIRDYFPEVTWAAARISGTRLFISVKENEVLSHIPDKEDTPCDLVASKPGIISDIVVRRGKAKVKAGDQVEEGQVLVSGTIPIYNDSEEISAVHYVQADADILAFTEYPFSQQFSRIHSASAETGRKKYGFCAVAGPWSAVLLFPSKEEETWIYQQDIHQVKLFTNFYLPVYWGIIQGKEVKTYEAFYTKNEITQVSEGIYQNFVKNLSEKGVQIIQNDVKILEDESVCKMEGIIHAKEPIAQIQQITDPKETNNNEDEHSGEYH